MRRHRATHFNSDGQLSRAGARLWKVRNPGQTPDFTFKDIEQNFQVVSLKENEALKEQLIALTPDLQNTDQLAVMVPDQQNMVTNQQEVLPGSQQEDRQIDEPEAQIDDQHDDQDGETQEDVNTSVQDQQEMDQQGESGMYSMQSPWLLVLIAQRTGKSNINIIKIPSPIFTHTFTYSCDQV